MKRLSLSLVFASLACSSSPPAGPPPDLPSAEDAWEQVRLRAQNRTSLRAEGRVTYFGDQGRVRVRAVLLAARPASFRLETVSPFGQTLDVMVCDGEQLTLLSQDRMRRGPAIPENVARLVPLALFPREVVDTLLGGLPGAGRFTPLSIDSDKDGNWVLAVRAADGQEATVRVDPASLAVLEMELGGSGKAARASVRFSDFEPVEAGGAFARELKFTVAKPSARVDIALKRPELNAELDPALFVLQVPDGVTPEPF